MSRHHPSAPQIGDEPLKTRPAAADKKGNGNRPIA
jgi:hypothetical protein